MAQKIKKLSHKQVVTTLVVAAVVVAAVVVYSFLSNAGGVIPAGAPLPEGRYGLRLISDVYTGDFYNGYRKAYGKCYFAKSNNPNYVLMNVMALGAEPVNGAATFAVRVSKSSLNFTYGDQYGKGALVETKNDQDGVPTSAIVLISRHDKGNCYAPLPPVQEGK